MLERRVRALSFALVVCNWLYDCVGTGIWLWLGGFLWSVLRFFAWSSVKESKCSVVVYWLWHWCLDCLHLFFISYNKQYHLNLNLLIHFGISNVLDYGITFGNGFTMHSSLHCNLSFAYFLLVFIWICVYICLEV